jgi:rod shape determining protein RodA
MIQSMITIGSGNFFGKGLGLGTQSRLAFLPEHFTDFAFASLVEQFGFLGGFLVLSCYFIILLILLRKLIFLYNQHNKDGIRRFNYVLGFITFLFFQIIVNIGMNLGIMPIAGISLPFISYGGSSVMAVMVGLALVP